MANRRSFTLTTTQNGVRQEAHNFFDGAHCRPSLPSGQIHPLGYLNRNDEGVKNEKTGSREQGSNAARRPQEGQGSG